MGPTPPAGTPPDTLSVPEVGLAEGEGPEAVLKKECTLLNASASRTVQKPELEPSTIANGTTHIEYLVIIESKHGNLPRYSSTSALIMLPSGPVPFMLDRDT